jgi:hypothetical protein
VNPAGTPDTRPGTWGNTAFAENVATFSPPAGYRVRVLRVYADFIGWPESGVPPNGSSCEIGWGLKTSAPDGSARLSVVYDNSFVWLAKLIPIGLG